jgi:hypothetical protein
MNYAGLADRPAAAVDRRHTGNQSRSLVRLIQRGRVRAGGAAARSGQAGRNGSPTCAPRSPTSCSVPNGADPIARAVERLGDDASAGMAERLQREAAAEAARHERLNSLSRRMEAAEALDPDAAIAELRDAMEGPPAKCRHDLSARRTGAAASGRLARLDPARVDARVQAIADLKAKLSAPSMIGGRSSMAAKVDLASARPDFSVAARDIADSVFDKLTGRATTDSGSALPEYSTPITRGPMKDRTFNIPDALVTQFLDSNVLSVAERYGRTMAAETELTRRFGRADMRDQVDAIRRDYADLRKAAGTDEARLKALAADEHGAIEDLTAMRDLIRAPTRPQRTAAIGAASCGLTAFNYPQHGPRRALEPLRSVSGRDVAGPWPLHVAGLARARDEPRRDQAIGQRGAAGRAGGRSACFRTGSQPLVRSAIRTAAAPRLSACFRTAPVSPRSGTACRSSPICRRACVDHVAESYSGSGGGQGGRHAVPRLSRHRQGHERTRRPRVRAARPGARRHQRCQYRPVVGWRSGAPYRAAVSKEVDSVVVTRSVGDVPLFANTPLGKAILQFHL